MHEAEKSEGTGRLMKMIWTDQDWSKVRAEKEAVLGGYCWRGVRLPWGQQ